MQVFGYPSSAKLPPSGKPPLRHCSRKGRKSQDFTRTLKSLRIGAKRSGETAGTRPPGEMLQNQESAGCGWQHKEMRTIIFGDIHGCVAPLRALLERIHPEPGQDRIVFLGDLFDRGPDSREVYLQIRKLAEAFGDDFICCSSNSVRAASSQ